MANKRQVIDEIESFMMNYNPHPIFPCSSKVNFYNSLKEIYSRSCERRLKFRSQEHRKEQIRSHFINLMNDKYNGNLDKQWDNIIGDEYGRCMVINNQPLSVMAIRAARFGIPHQLKVITSSCPNCNSRYLLDKVVSLEKELKKSNEMLETMKSALEYNNILKSEDFDNAVDYDNMKKASAVAAKVANAASKYITLKLITF